MKKCVIAGNGDYSVMLKRYIEMTTEWKIAGFTADILYIKEKEIEGIPVIPAETFSDSFSKEEVFLIMGIGYSKMSAVRKAFFERFSGMGYEFCNYVHPTAIISPDAVIGTGNNIFEGVLVQANTVIGDCNLIYGKSVIGHDCRVGSYNSVSLNVTVAGCVTIGNNCFIGAGATVRDHIKINDYALVGAGAYADGDVKEYSVIAPVKSVELFGKVSTDFI